MSDEVSNEQIKKIVDEADMLQSIEGEVVKLYALLRNCDASIKQDGKEFLNREYVLEKVCRILDRIPIILSAGTKNLYAAVSLLRGLYPPCSHCLDGKLCLVKANPPWTEDHLQCEKCDSTYCKEQFK